MCPEVATHCGHDRRRRELVLPRIGPITTRGSVDYLFHLACIIMVEIVFTMFVHYLIPSFFDPLCSGGSVSPIVS